MPTLVNITMRILIVLAITLLFFGCKSPKESSDSVDDFNTFLGASQSKVLDKTIISFERFLEVNYGSEKSSELRLKAFLESIIFMNQQSSWTFDLENNKILLSEWESSGLRREIELYGYEDYSPTCDIFGLLPHDTIDHSNSDTIKFGTMEYALAEEDLLPMSPEDSLKYIEDTARANSKIRKIMAHRDSILNFNRFGKFLYGLNKVGY